MEYGFFGDYSSWSEAMKHCTGYDDPAILEKVKSAALRVKSGEAVYERDSVLFDRIEYSYPLLTYLLYIASVHDNRLNVVDFGGSLGTTYYQCRDFLRCLRSLRWSIIDQKHFVECGRELFQDNTLRFYDDISSCLDAEKPDVILFSGVLQCLEDPYAFMAKVLQYRCEYIVFDRTPLIDAPDRLTVQVVPPSIYEASYPAWFFNADRFRSLFRGSYEIVDETNSFESTLLVDGTFAQSEAILLRKCK